MGSLGDNVTIMGTRTMEKKIPKPLWRETPLIQSDYLSKSLGCKVLLKLDLHQPSGSFKSRGIGNYLRKAYTSRSPGLPNPHFYCSSGGNAGLACVVAASTLNCRATIVVPHTTPLRMREKLLEAGADEVVVSGNNWSEADGHLRTIISNNPDGIYVPPFDHPDIWAGHSTIIDELAHQVPEETEDPNAQASAIFCSVGGGGLFCGIMQGLERHGWDETHVMAVETRGADALTKSVESGKLIRLAGITSEAVSLGATQVAAKAFEHATGKKKDMVMCCIVDDLEGKEACVEILEKERVMVELSCGASWAAATPDRVEALLGRKIRKSDVLVLIVCGGSLVTWQQISDWDYQVKSMKKEMAA